MVAMTVDNEAPVSPRCVALLLHAACTTPCCPPSSQPRDEIGASARQAHINATKHPGYAYAIDKTTGRVLPLPTWARANDVWSTTDHEDMCPISADKQPWGTPGLGNHLASPTCTWLCTAALNDYQV
jgi:hypothetical protein